MRAINSDPDWNDMLRRLQTVFQPGGPCEGGWGLYTHGFSIYDAGGGMRVKLHPQEGLRILILVVRGTELVNSGSWLKQLNGSWQSAEWGCATKAGMLDHIEQFCREAVGCL